MYDIKQAVG